jgi:uncharacterized protein (TIGR00251 family)
VVSSPLGRPSKEFPFLSVQGQEISLLVLVQPRASSSRLLGEHGGRLKIAISSPAVDGKANKALIEFLAELLKVPKRTIELSSGSAGRQKTPKIRDVSGIVRSRLLDALKNSG